MVLDVDQEEEEEEKKGYERISVENVHLNATEIGVN